MSVQQPSPNQTVAAEYFPGDVIGSIQLLVADAGSRRTIQSMLDDYFEVIIDDTVVAADLYLVEDRLLGRYGYEIVAHVNEARPAFCPLVVIQGRERKLAPVLHSEAEGDDPVLIDDVVEAPVDRSQLVRRVHSLLIRRIQSVELQERVAEVEAQAQQLRRYQEGVESSGNGILLIDPAGTIDTANTAFEELTGYSAEQAVGESPAFLQPDDAEAVFTPDFWQTLSDSREWEGDLIIELKAGQRRVVTATLTVISTEDTIEGFVLLLSDITERIQREQALADSEAELDLLRQILSRYLRHNLRNELNIIQGYGEMLADDELTTTEQRKWAEKIVEVSNRLIETSEKARTYSSLIKQDSAIAEFDLSKIVNNEVTKLRETQQDAEFDLSLPDSCIVQARQGIEQAICGLIQNAVIHNEAESPSITIQIEKTDGARVVIEDNGPGIPQNEVAALETGEETPLSHSQGVGLWLSKWVIESSGGDLYFDPSEDGTRVTVEIPPAGRIERDSLDIPSIKEREQRFESIVDRMTDAVLQVDSEWKITFLDERAEEILGVEAEAILGEDLWEQFGAALDTSFEETYRTAMDTRSTERILDYYQPIETWLEVVVYPEFDGGLSFFFRDVTEEQSRQEDLERAQERIEFALTATDATVWEWDFVNDSIITHPDTHTGLETDVSTLDDFLAGIHPNDQSRVQEALRKAIDSGEPYQIEYRVPTEEGIRWLEDSGEIRYQDGSPTEMIGTARDITVRKDRERKYEAIFNQTYQFTGLMELDGTLIEANETALTFGGLSPDEVIGKKVWNAHWFTISEETQEQTKEDVQRAARGEFVRRELEVKGDTDTVVIDFSIRPVTDEDGTVRYLIPEGRDITDLKEREHELQERVKELNALHGTREIFDRSDQSIPELLTEFVELIPESFQHPERADARVTFNGERISTGQFDSERHSINSSAEIMEGTTLSVEVTLTQGNGAETGDTFLAEEQELLDTLVSIVSAELTERVHRERLERFKARFDAILDHTETPMFMKDDSGVYLFVNQAYRDLFDLDDGAIIGRTDHDIHPTEMADEVSKNDQRVIETGETLETEERINVNGDERIYRSTKVPIYDTGDRADTDRPVAVFGLAQDISELKEQKEQLRKERNRFRAVFDKAFDAMVLADDQAYYTDVNASAVELFGLPESELIGCSIRDFAPEDFDFDAAWQTFQESEAERGTFPVVRPDGTRRMVEYAATTNVTPGEHLSVLRDVTERERRERRLERFETIVETAGDPVYTLDTEGRFTYVNTALVEITGYQKDTLLHEHASIVLNEEDVERGEELIQTLLTTERDLGTYEMDLVIASGYRIPCENHIGVLPFDEEFRGTVGILRNLTERKERERQLQRQNERLDAFTSVVSHDLRNPLNVAEGRLDLAQEECESEHLPVVEQSLHRIETLIDDLLELARHGESIGEREPIALRKLVETCWENVETADAALDVEIERTINADNTRLRQVFENLIRNAVEHGGQDVTITVGELDGGFYIEDDGPGIPEDERKEIFEAGYSTSNEGTGFGLSIVKEILEAHGWNIYATEGNAGGARFEITRVEFVEV